MIYEPVRVALEFLNDSVPSPLMLISAFLPGTAGPDPGGCTGLYQIVAVVQPETAGHTPDIV